MRIKRFFNAYFCLPRLLATLYFILLKQKNQIKKSIRIIHGNYPKKPNEFSTILDYFGLLADQTNLFTLKRFLDQSVCGSYGHL